MDEVNNEQSGFMALLTGKSLSLGNIESSDTQKRHHVDEMVDLHGFCFITSLIDDLEAHKTVNLVSLSKSLQDHDNWNNPCGLELMFQSYDVSKPHCSFFSRDEFSPTISSDAIKSAQSLYFSEKTLQQASDMAKVGQFAKALQLLQKSCEYNKHNWDAFLLRAEISLKAGDKKSSLVDIEYVLKSDEGNITALRMFQSLDKDQNAIPVTANHKNARNFDPIISKLHESLSLAVDSDSSNRDNRYDDSDTSSSHRSRSDSDRKKKRKKKDKKHKKKKKHKKQKVEKD